MSATWQPYRKGASGIIGADERHGQDPFTIELPAAGSGMKGGLAALTASFYAPIEAVVPALARARERFIEVAENVRAEIIATPEYAALADVAQRIAVAAHKTAELGPRIRTAEQERDALLTAGTDAAYAKADSEAAGLRDRHARLVAEHKRLMHELPALENALQARASTIAAKICNDSLAEIEPELSNLAGLLAGEPLALDRIVELSELRGRLRSEGGQVLARQLVQEIVAGIKSQGQAAGPVENVFARNATKAGAA
jgi:hypothetical protein